jgi:hypothetical protein
VQAYTVTDAAGGEVTTLAWGDTVNIVLRVCDHASARNHVTADAIIARINSSVFQYTGTGEISQLFQQNDCKDQYMIDNKDGSASADYHAYDYYSYVLLFRDVKYVGGGNTLNLNLTYNDTSMAMQQFSVTIGQCVDKDPNDPNDAKTPGLVIRSSSYGSSIITAGSPFTLSLTVYSTSGTETLNDVVVSLTLPENVSLTGGSLSAYVGTMGPKSSRDVSFEILPAAGIQKNVADVKVDLTGTGAVSGKGATGSCTISVPISQPDRFEIEKLDMPDSFTVGTSSTISLSFVNKGKNAVSNLEAAISGANLGPDGAQSQYIGNINAGTENSVDFDVTPDMAGTISGTITLTYEGQDGSAKTVTKDFSGSVIEAASPEEGTPGELEPETKKACPPPIIVLIVIAAAAAVTLVVVHILRKKHKVAAMAKLEDDSGDEDI